MTQSPKASTKEVRPMRPEAALAEAGRAVLLEQVKKLRKNLPQASQSQDPEVVHKLRVTTRRLRAELQLLEETVYLPDQVQPFRRKLRKLADPLGQIRDSDVLLEHLAGYARNLAAEQQAGLEPLRQTLLEQRQAGQMQLARQLASPKLNKLLDKLEDFTSTPGAGVSPKPPDRDEVVPEQVRHFQGSTVWRRYEQVLAYEAVAAPDLQVLHRLRVAFKRLRYTLEFFESALPGEITELVAPLVQAQDLLGQVHDYTVATDLLEHLPRKASDKVALQNYAAYRAQEKERHLAEFGELWPLLIGPDYRQRLANLLSR